MIVMKISCWAIQNILSRKYMPRKKVDCTVRGRQLLWEFRILFMSEKGLWGWHSDRGFVKAGVCLELVCTKFVWTEKKKFLLLFWMAEGRGATIVQIGTQTLHTIALFASLFLCTPGQSVLDCWLGIIKIVRCSLSDIWECVGGGGFTRCSTIQ